MLLISEAEVGHSLMNGENWRSGIDALAGLEVRC